VKILLRLHWTILTWLMDSKYPEFRTWHHFKWSWIYFGHFPPPDTFGMRFDHYALWNLTEDDPDFEDDENPYDFYWEQG